MVVGQVGLYQHVHQHVELVIKFDRGKKKKRNNVEFSFLRNCSNPTPQYGGIYCIGSGIDTILCNVSNITCPSK